MRQQALTEALNEPDASLELPRLLARMHRRYLDLLRVELGRIGANDINPVQAFLLLDLGNDETGVQDLVARGYYVASNALYNIKKLVEAGYFEQSRSQHDRRAMRVKPTRKAMEICDKIRQRQTQIEAASAGRDGTSNDSEIAYASLRRIERAWDDYLRYGRI